MMILVVVALFAVARAELFETLMRNEIEAAVEAIHNTEHSHITLRDLEDQERMLMVRELQTDIAKTLSDKLDNVTAQIVGVVTDSKTKLLVKIKELNILFDKFKLLVQDLKDLGTKAGDHIKIVVAELKVKLQTLLDQHVSPAVQMVINFVNTLFGGGSSHLAALERLEDEVTTEVVLRALQRRGVITDFFGNLFGGIVDTAKDVLTKMLTGLHGKFKELGQFLLDLAKEHLNNAKPHIDNLKQLAQEFIDHAKEATNQTLQEALEFFGAYKNDLGGLYQQLVDAVNKIKGHIQATIPPTGPTF